MLQRGSLSNNCVPLCWENYSAWRVTSKDHPTSSCHQLSMNTSHPPETIGDLRMGFTEATGHFSAAGARTANSAGIRCLSWLLRHAAVFWKENSRMIQIAPYWQHILHCSLNFCRFQLFAWPSLLLFPDIYFSLPGFCELAYLAADPLLPWSYPSMSSYFPFSFFLRPLDLILLTAWAGILDTARSPCLVTGLFLIFISKCMTLREYLPAYRRGILDSVPALK